MFESTTKSKTNLNIMTSIEVFKLSTIISISIFAFTMVGMYLVQEIKLRKK